MLLSKRMLKVVSATVFFVYFVICVADSASESLEKSDGPAKLMYPRDKKNYGKDALNDDCCGMHGLSTVSDPNGIFTEREEFELDRLIRRLRCELKCYCSSCTNDCRGLSVGIAAMTSMYRDFKTEPKTATIEFAESLRLKWNLGPCNNDILIVISTKDHSWYASLGETARSILPRYVWDIIMAKAQESFDDENFYKGLSNMLSDMFDKIQAAEQRSSTTPNPPRSAPKKDTGMAFMFTILFIVGEVLVFVSGAMGGILYWKKKQQQLESSVKKDVASELNMVNDECNEPNTVNDECNEPNTVKDECNEPNTVKDECNEPNTVNGECNEPNIRNEYHEAQDQSQTQPMEFQEPAVLSFFRGDKSFALLQESKKLISKDRLSLGDEIGKGSFALVYKADLHHFDRDKSEEVAVKTLQITAPSRKKIDGFIQEALIMKDFDHPRVLHLIGVSFFDDMSPYLVTPYMANGSFLAFLNDKHNILFSCHLIDFAIEIAEGMEYLASHKIVHRDLAARNCLLDKEYHVKIADFGLSRDISEKDYYRSEQKYQLPMKWMAPESLEEGKFTTKSDVWSFGVTFWEIMTRGKTPYMEISNFDIILYLKKGQRLPRPEKCSEPLYNLMQRCWSWSPRKRPSFSDIVAKQ